jgi:hypothetical protein
MNWRYPAQEQNYLDNPAKLDYEKQLGHSQLNFTDYDEFLRHTDPKQGTRKQESGTVQPEAPIAPPEGAASPTPDPSMPPPRKKHATKQEVRDRLITITYWLVEGYSTPEIINNARQAFGIGTRMVQLYLQRVRAKMAEEASQADYLAHLYQSKLQHDHLYAKAASKLHHCGEDPKVFATLLRGCLQVLKARDNLMAAILEHRMRTKRDQSPDSRQARARRSRKMVMPVEEFWERLEHLRNSWFWEWNQEQMQKADAEKLLREQAAGDATSAEKPIAD